jgi:hypothetical protein
MIDALAAQVEWREKDGYLRFCRKLLNQLPWSDPASSPVKSSGNDGNLNPKNERRMLI